MTDHQALHLVQIWCFINSATLVLLGLAFVRQIKTLLLVLKTFKEITDILTPRKPKGDNNEIQVLSN